jgi:hypothetical protein
MNYFYLLVIILLLQPDSESQKHFTEYEGGRWGYSTTRIKLYSDSTYNYYESVNRLYIKDEGIWKKDKKGFVLNSKKTRSKSTGNSSKKHRFKNQKFSITGDTLQLIPKEIEDISYYNAYYKMIRVNK